MARVILPARPRARQPTSIASQSNAAPPTNAPRAVATHPFAEGSFDYIRVGDRSTLGASEEEGDVSPAPIPSIERSPSPASSMNANDTPSPVLTPRQSTLSSPGLNDILGDVRETQHSPTVNSTGRRPPHHSLSISPPPSAGPAARSSIAVSDIESMEITSDLGDMRLTSKGSSQQPRTGLDMTGIGDAIDGVVRGEDTRPAGSSLVVSPSGHSRRRSSPRPEPVIHKVEDEELPDDEFHHPAFQEKLSQTRRTLENLARVLSSSSIHLDPDSTVKRHHDEAASLSRFHPLVTRTVGLVGESGVGKSSLINSLLDRSSLARTTGRGSACTCVVTEYHFHPADNYVIDVDMFSEDELCEQLAELLSCYRARPGEESQEKADLAIATFRSMFRGRLDDEEWILAESQAVVLNQFETWAKEARRPGLTARQVAETLEECSSILVPLSSEPSDPSQSSLWPYIRKIKVYLNANILSKGLILVDLPGLRDLNSARRNITQQYVVNCHEIFAVCGIKRAITDEGVKTVFDIAQQARLERVGIICTNADDINLNEVHSDWAEEEAQPIRDLKRSMDAIDGEIEEIKQEFATFENLPPDDAASHRDKLALLEEKWSLENRRDAIDFQLQELAIKTRNSHVAHEIRTEYTAQAHGETLNVFCVGNKMYQDRRNLDKSVSRKYLNLSGIIDVRKHLVALVGESQLRASKNFLEHQVPALLRDVELWVQSGSRSASAEEKQAVRDILDKVEKKLQKGLASRRSSVSTIERSLTGSFETRIWEGSFAAWLRNKGDYHTKTVQRRNWNQEVMEDMVVDVDSTWDDLLSDVRFHKGTLKQAVAACWEEAITLLESEWPDSNGLVDEIGRALDVRKKLLLNTVEDIFDRFNDLMSVLHRDTLTSLNGSMITRIMSSVCREALKYSGTGCDKPRKAIVTRTFANEGVIHDITKKLRRGFKDHAEDLQQALVELVSMQLDATRITLDIAREENAVQENERDPEFRQRVADEVARARSLVGM